MLTGNKMFNCGLTFGIVFCLVAIVPNSYAKGGSDKPPKTNFQLTEDIAYGVRLEAEMTTEDNYNLDDGDPEDETRSQPLISGALRYKPTENFAAFLSVDFWSNFYDDEAGKKQDKTELAVNNAYLQFDNVISNLDIKIGRMRFKDEREWLLDDELDGARINYEISDFNLELATFEKRNKSTLNDDGGDEDIRNILLYASYQYSKDNEVSTYYLIQDDQTAAGRNSELFGLQSHGEWGDMDYWMELGLAGGEETVPLVTGDIVQDVDAWGYDVGFVYTFKGLDARPRLIAGYAFGSGDDDSTVGTNENYRQSGYQDNASKHGGIERYNVYGEMVDIELSNVRITTVGLGFRPHKSATLDIVYHTYEQSVASAFIRDSEIDELPNGVDTGLGSAMDVVLGIRPTKNIKASMILGYFYPGKALTANSDDAFYSELKLKYTF